MIKFNLFIIHNCPCNNIKLYEIFFENGLYNLIYSNYRNYLLDDLMLLDNLNLF